VGNYVIADPSDLGNYVIADRLGDWSLRSGTYQIEIGGHANDEASVATTVQAG
jgi:hypothetical protein